MAGAGLPSQVEMLWWVALGIGAVVAVVLVVLLHTLLNTVRRIERDVVNLWTTATTVARNTATTWLLADTADVVGEIERHATGASGTRR